MPPITLEDQLELDSRFKSLEQNRDLTQVWLHVDMDGFVTSDPSLLC
jgi:hypothetical protein